MLDCYCCFICGQLPHSNHAWTPCTKPTMMCGFQIYPSQPMPSHRVVHLRGCSSQPDLPLTPHSTHSSLGMPSSPCSGSNIPHIPPMRKSYPSRLPGLSLQQYCCPPPSGFRTEFFKKKERKEKEMEGKCNVWVDKGKGKGKRRLGYSNFKMIKFILI